jgi:N-acetylmuramoyl-L-alanine amidase
MITILFYLLKVVLCSALLYTYYWFVLRNKQFHQYNRFYLMGISVLSWLIPFIKIDIIKEQVVAAPKVLNFVDLIADKNSSIEQDVIIKSSHFNWDNLLLIIAISISLLLIIRFVKSLWNIRKLIKQYPLKKLVNLYLVMTDVKGTPFSFFNYIFWNTSIDLNSEVGKKILAHEVAHIDENHSFDKLLIELQLVIGWFNPITWLIRNELYLIHEFIADQKSIQNNDTSILAELLLTSAYPSQQYILSNSFFFSPIKRRIQMFTTTNTKFSYLRRLTIMPIMAAMILLFAFRNGNINSRPIVKLDKQYTVIIDAGHGGKDLGAIAADGTTEKDLALAIALKVKSINNNPNINILLSRETDKFITVVDRADFANASNANLFVSIHMDKAGTAKFTGTTCYIPSKNKLYLKESNMIAKNILASTSELFPKSKITTRERGIWVIENVKMPSVLFESGFISNPNDLKLVKANEEKIANNILDAISTYFSNPEKVSMSIDTSKPNSKSSVKSLSTPPTPPTPPNPYKDKKEVSVDQKRASVDKEKSRLLKEQVLIKKDRDY